MSNVLLVLVICITFLTITIIAVSLCKKGKCEGFSPTVTASGKYPEDFGCDPSGGTDCRVGLQNWLDSGKNAMLRVTEGATYFAQISSTAKALRIKSGCTIQGHATIHVEDISDKTYVELFNAKANDLLIDGLSFLGTIQEGKNGFCFVLGGGTKNVTFMNGGVDLQNVIGGNGSGVHQVNGFSFNHSFDSHTWRNFFFKRCNYATIKENANTSTQNETRIEGCMFKNNARGNLTGFNSPSGLSENIFILHNRFIREKEYWSDVQDQSLLGGTAGGTAVQIVGNYAYGYGRDVIHIEETTGPVLIANNQWVHLGGGTDGGITFRNNEIGEDLPPLSSERLTIVNNTGITQGSSPLPGPQCEIRSDTVWAMCGTREYKHWGVGVNGITKSLEDCKYAYSQGSNKDASCHPRPTNPGIWCVWDSRNVLGGQDVIISNNNLEGYSTGIYLGDATQGPVQVFGNLIKGCEVGIKSVYPSQAVMGNTISECAIGLEHKYTGIWGKNHFIDCVDLFVSTSESAIVTGWSTQYSNVERDLLPICEMPLSARGTLSYVMRSPVLSTYGDVTISDRVIQESPVFPDGTAAFSESDDSFSAKVDGNGSNLWMDFAGSWSVD